MKEVDRFAKKDVEQIRVLICHCESLLELGIESVLSQYTNIEITNCIPKDEPEFYALVDGVRPDVVIVEQCSPVAKEPILSQLLLNSPRIRVVQVSAGSNLLHIYQKHELLMTALNDLIQIVQASKGDWIYR